MDYRCLCQLCDFSCQLFGSSDLPSRDEVCLAMSGSPLTFVESHHLGELSSFSKDKDMKEVAIVVLGGGGGGFRLLAVM